MKLHFATMAPNPDRVRFFLQGVAETSTKGRDTFEAMAEEHEQWILELFAGLPANTVQQLYSQLGTLRVQLVRQQDTSTKDNK